VSELREGRIPLEQAEHDAVDKLIANNADAAVSFTRRDPGDTGPLLVHVNDDTYVVSKNGAAKKQKAT
jgi:hypothetical protein